MDHEMKELLEKNLALNEENNRLLRGLRRSNRISLIWNIFYIAIFLGGAALAFSYLRPYYEGFMHAYQTITTTQEQVNQKFTGFKAFFGEGEQGTTTQN